MRLANLSNFECGVVVPGSLIEGLLEEGTENWQAGIVTYDQSDRQYNLMKEVPWNGKRRLPPVIHYSPSKCMRVLHIEFLLLHGSILANFQMSTKIWQIQDGSRIKSNHRIK